MDGNINQAYDEKWCKNSLEQFDKSKIIWKTIN